MKDVLIITNYYPPEMGAASNRIFQLAQGLSKNDYNVSVVTPLPNYPTGKIFTPFRGKFISSSTENDIKIFRLWIYASNSKNKFKRFLAMLSYSFSITLFILFNKIPKIVIIQSPPLLVAFTSLFFIRSKHRKLVLNVSDLWPLAGEKLGAINKGISYNILKRIEKFNYSKASLILGQSEEILSHVTTIAPNTKTFLYRNYPSFNSPVIPYRTKGGQLKLVYAGLLGVAQGIYSLCQKINLDKVEFHIYGNGSEKDLILNFIKENPQKSIFYHGQLTRLELHKTLVKYDLTIVPLVDRIYGSVPSKIFEYAKLGLPILYFGGGEGEKLINKFDLGWVTQAGDFIALNNVISKIDLQTITKDYKDQIQTRAQLNFNFNNQLSELIKAIDQ